MMVSSVYLSNSFLKPVISLLKPDWRVVSGWEQHLDDKQQEISALATTVWDKVDAEYLSQFPDLKIICHLGLGTDNIDLNYVQQRNISLFSQPSSGVHDTAELALTLMLNLARKIRLNDIYTRNNDWVEKKPRFLGNHLKGKQLGLVGLGQIGSTIARFAQALEMNIAYTTRNKRDNSFDYYPDVVQLAKVSDVLVVCCSAGSDTRHLINKNVLECLGANGYLVNVARGSIVDQDALIDALNNKVIAGAGLDVFADEPEVPELLRSMDNVLLSPHMGSSTKENLESMFQLQAQQLNDYLQEIIRGRDLVTNAHIE